MKTLEINPVLLMQAVARDMKKKGLYVNIGSCDLPKVEDENGVVRRLKIPFQIRVNVADTKDKAYWISTSEGKFLLQTVQQIAYTFEYEHPLFHAVFTAYKKSRPVLVEADTYRIVKNGLADVIKNMRYC